MVALFHVALGFGFLSVFRFWALELARVKGGFRLLVI